MCRYNFLVWFLEIFAFILSHFILHSVHCWHYRWYSCKVILHDMKILIRGCGSFESVICSSKTSSSTSMIPSRACLSFLLVVRKKLSVSTIRFCWLSFEIPTFLKLLVIIATLDNTKHDWFSMTTTSSMVFWAILYWYRSRWYSYCSSSISILLSMIIWPHNPLVLWWVTHIRRYSIEVPMWVHRKNSFIKLLITLLKMISNRHNKQQNCASA